MKKKLVVLFILLGILIAVFIFTCYNREKVYILKEYSPNGKLIGTNEYVLINGDTVMHGKFVNYNENGVKISEGQFINNEPYGICSYYNDSGKIESVFLGRTVILI